MYPPPLCETFRDQMLGGRAPGRRGRKHSVKASGKKLSNEPKKKKVHYIREKYDAAQLGPGWREEEKKEQLAFRKK